MKSAERAERLGRFRDILNSIAQGGPNVSSASDYRQLREELVGDDVVHQLLPEFVIECRSPRDFWNYIQRAFRDYGGRTRYIEAQLLPIERQFRPERQRSPGMRPPEVRIEYSPLRPPSLGVHRYVSDDRLAELRALAPSNYDLAKLVRLCEELNVTSSEGALFATAMLVRAILDHVPPLFGCSTFSQVASNYSGGRSFKETMERLDTSARKIADAHLHTQIRAKESLPAPQQVNFAAELDVLLAEIARIAK
jgi:hypothetical protein